jgi:hypothetical protein
MPSGTPGAADEAYEYGGGGPEYGCRGLDSAGVGAVAIEVVNVMCFVSRSKPSGFTLFWSNNLIARSPPPVSL